MDDEETKEDEGNICPLCGLRQYNKICAACNIEIEDEEKDLDKRKEDEADEYDWR